MDFRTYFTLLRYLISLPIPSFLISSHLFPSMPPLSSLLCLLSWPFFSNTGASSFYSWISFPTHCVFLEFYLFLMAFLGLNFQWPLASPLQCSKRYSNNVAQMELTVLPPWIFKDSLWFNYVQSLKWSQKLESILILSSALLLSSYWSWKLC